MIEKSVCDRGFVWNPINCECKGHKLCDNGGYLDYGNWKCRKTLAEECTENVEEIELAEITLKWLKMKMSTLSIVLFLIMFTINVGIGT